MKQFSDEKICKYCYGCNKLELENFEGFINCSNFLPADKKWQEKYYEALRRNK